MTDKLVEHPGARWKWALTAAAVGGAVQLPLKELAQLPHAPIIVYVLDFLLVPGELGVLVLEVIAGPAFHRLPALIGLTTTVSVLSNMLIYAGFGLLFRWLRGRPAYLYLLPVTAMLACWAVELGLAAMYSSHRAAADQWVTHTVPPFRERLLGEIVVGATTTQELVDRLGEPTCLRQGKAVDFFVYRAVRMRVRTVRPGYPASDFPRVKHFASRGDPVEELLHIVVVSDGIVSEVRELRTMTEVGDDEFSCDLLHLWN